jgi:hypothetical protein
MTQRTLSGAAFFVIVLGTAMMAWAALRSAVVPRWICFWLMTCGVLVFLSLWNPLVPALGIFGIFAPLQMLGYVMPGVSLLRRAVGADGTSLIFVKE